MNSRPFLNVEMKRSEHSAPHVKSSLRPHELTPPIIHWSVHESLDLTDDFRQCRELEPSAKGTAQ